MIVEGILIGLITTYCLFILILWLGWERIEIKLTDGIIPPVAVIIPVRNEEKNIGLLLNDLFEQSYEGTLELYIVNDHSEDNTQSIVQKSIKGRKGCNFLTLADETGKKAAIAKGIEATQAEIVLTTDGDCRLPLNWVATMVSFFKPATQLVSGPVSSLSGNGLFYEIQKIEFASLIGSGASLIGWNRPVMANGANLAFRRIAFLEVGGFDGNAHIASGDDVFLMHKITGKYTSAIAFAKSVDAIVQTPLPTSMQMFLDQRLRWASKWKAYTDNFTGSLALLVFLISLGMSLLLIFVAVGVVSPFLWLNLLVVKALFDFFYLRQLLRFSSDRIGLAAFVLLQLIHPYYVVLTALFSTRKTYHWKDRKVR